MDRMNDWITTGERPLPYFVVPFAASTSGGNDDDDDRDDDDLDDNEDDDPDAGKTDEELRAELKKVRESLGKANGQSAKRRQLLRDKERELEEARRPKPKPKGKGDEDDDGPDLDALRDEARREGETAGTMRAKKAEAKAELLAAGVNRERVARAVGLLNLGELDLDDDGLDGIDEEIEKLKAEWPELFAKPTRRREGVGGDREGGGGGENGRGKRAEMTPSERQAALITGARR